MLLADDFNENALDTTRWDTTDLFSGTQDSAIPVVETGQQIRIGPLLERTAGSHYTGIDSVQAYDFTGAAASAELVDPASTSATPYAMFTVGSTATTTGGFRAGDCASSVGLWRWGGKASTRPSPSIR